VRNTPGLAAKTNRRRTIGEKMISSLIEYLDQLGHAQQL
jgi:hypothetical protein